MKRLILLVALVMAMAVLAPAAFADNDTDEVEGADVEMEAKEPSAAQEFKARMIADYVGSIVNANPDWIADDPEVDAITDLRTGDPGIGWGVLLKLQSYEAACTVPIELLMDGDGYALGQIRKIYLERVEAGTCVELPYSNLGQLQKASKDKPQKPEKTMPPQANKDGKKHEN